VVRTSVAVLLGMVTCVGALCASPARADTGDDAERLGQAKELFRKGNALRQAGDCERATEYYARSRKILASVANTLNAAICFDRLGRLDEALSLYEQLLLDFRSNLSEANRNALAPKLRRLRRSVGSVDVAANVRGWLVIDGRPRGRLPLLSPVRVMPGEHTIAVLAEGFVPYTERITVSVGRTVLIAAKLDVLANAGTLRVEAQSLRGAKLYIDGAHVATAPWEGKLAPGRHIVFLRRGALGSAPRVVNIVDQRQTLLEATLSPLGPRQRLEVEPPGAALSIDGVHVARGRWQGRLPVGRHVIEGNEPGYHRASQEVRVSADRAADLLLTLKTDPEHARWQKPRDPGTLWFEAFAGPAVTSSLGSDAETFCKQGRCSANDDALGYASGVRVGYEWPLGLAVFASGGYLSLSKSLRRELAITHQASPPLSAQYSLGDHLQLSGPRVGLGLAYRHRLGDVLSVRVHADIGAVFTRSSDTVGGHARHASEVGLARVVRSGETLHAVDLFIAPEAQLIARFGRLFASLGLGASIMLLDGPQAASDPATHAGELIVVSPQVCGAASSLACAPGSDRVAGERSYGRFVLWRPFLSAGYAF
jgi:hypothetical protein